MLALMLWKLFAATPATYKFQRYTAAPALNFKLDSRVL
jgi:hypothetical protein